MNNIGRIIYPIHSIVSEKTLKKANEDINNHPINQGRRENVNTLRLCEGNSGSPNGFVHFNSEGKVENWTEFKEKRLKFSTDAIDQLAKEMLERFAQELGVKNDAIEFSFSILRYRVSEDSPVCNMPWHTDFCRVSMTVLITPSESDSGKWEGGNLCFAERLGPEPWDTGEIGLRSGGPDSKNAQSNPYPYNGGFIFDNMRSMHKVEDVRAVKGSCERRLATLFANVQPDNPSHLLYLEKIYNSGGNLTPPKVV